MNVELLLLSLFLPLFPFSAIFSFVFKKLSSPGLSVLLLLAWPQIGLGLVDITQQALPSWLIGWAVVTAILYAWRALVLRDLMMWVLFMAISSWALLWAIAQGQSAVSLKLFALGFSLSLVVMVLLAAQLQKRFQAAYAGLSTGIAETLPRLSWLLVAAVLGVVATPVFPGFFAMLSSVLVQVETMPWIAVGLMLVWFFWSWSGMRLLQGLVTGPAAQQHQVEDLSYVTAVMFGIPLLVNVALGLYMAGGL